VSPEFETTSNTVKITAKKIKDKINPSKTAEKKSGIGDGANQKPSIGDNTGNVINLKHNVGSKKEFDRKVNRLQNAADDNGGLIFKEGTSDIRKPAQQAKYRRQVKKRYQRYLENNGFSKTEAKARVDSVMSSKQADHIVELQVSGHLSDPNSFKNLKMVEGSINSSIGKQIDLETTRLGLKDGDIVSGFNKIDP